MFRTTTLLGQAEVKLAEALYSYNEQVEIYTFKLSPDNPRDMLKAELIARVHRQPTVRKWAKKKLLREAKVTILKTREKGLAAYIQAVSREITRRGDEMRGAGRTT